MNGLIVDIHILSALHLQSTKVYILLVKYTTETFFNYLTYLLIKTKDSITIPSPLLIRYRLCVEALYKCRSLHFRYCMLLFFATVGTQVYCQKYKADTPIDKRCSDKKIDGNHGREGRHEKECRQDEL